MPTEYSGPPETRCWVVTDVVRTVPCSESQFSGGLAVSLVRLCSPGGRFGFLPGTQNDFQKTDGWFAGESDADALHDLEGAYGQTYLSPHPHPEEGFVGWLFAGEGVGSGVEGAEFGPPFVLSLFFSAHWT